MSKFDALDAAFNAKSVAVVGVPATEVGFNTGRLFTSAILEYGFQGRLYPVHPDGGQISGLNIYQSIGQIPEPVDYVISCIRAPLIPNLIRECSTAGAGVICLFTAGFSETGIATNLALELEIAQIARETGMHIIGPNCMGVFSPRARLSFATDFPKDTGQAGLISQSGGNTLYIVRACAARGVNFSKAISYGNGIDIDESDLMDYFRQDNETKMLALYVEGVKDGARFFPALKELSKEKPVVFLKGGRTPRGAVAVASHTASLAGSDEVWSRILEQAGAIQVDTLDEITDMLVALSQTTVPLGKRVITLGIGGGASVIAADDWDKAGFTQPTLPEEMAAGFRKALGNDAGTSMSNPIDIPHLGLGDPVFHEALEAMLGWEGVDILSFHLPLRSMMLSVQMGDVVISSEIDTLVRLRRETTKPMVGIIHYLANAESWQYAVKYVKRLNEADIPVFYSVASAAKAINRLLRFRGRLGMTEAHK